jgi:hypothetical protein
MILNFRAFGWFLEGYDCLSSIRAYGVNKYAPLRFGYFYPKDCWHVLLWKVIMSSVMLEEVVILCKRVIPHSSWSKTLLL